MATLILRPNGVGAYANIADEVPDAAAHWTVVDEAAADDTDYVNQNVIATQYDVYALEDTVTTGTITAVAVYFRCRTSGAGVQQATPRLRLGTSETTGSAQTVTGTWTTYSQTLARPGGGSWDWADIPSLQGGVGLTEGANPAWCSWLYVEITYTAIVDKTASDSLGMASTDGLLPQKGKSRTDSLALTLAELALKGLVLSAADALALALVEIPTTAALPSMAPLFRVEVRNSSGVLLAYLENAYNAGWEAALNEIGRCFFRLPGDDDKAAHLAVGNEVWLYERNKLVDVYRIRAVRRTRG